MSSTEKKERLAWLKIDNNEITLINPEDGTVRTFEYTNAINDVKLLWDSYLYIEKIDEDNEMYFELYSSLDSNFKIKGYALNELKINNILYGLAIKDKANRQFFVYLRNKNGFVNEILRDHCTGKYLYIKNPVLIEDNEMIYLQYTSKGKSYRCRLNEDEGFDEGAYFIDSVIDK